MKALPDIKTLKSNYIFKRVGEHFKAQYETYVKWYMAGAINGILLNFENNKIIDLSCFDLEGYKKLKLSTVESTIKCDDLFIYVYSDRFDFPEIEQIVLGANEEFNNNIIASAWIDIINKLHLSIIINTKADPLSLKNKIIESISNLIPASGYQSSDLKPLELDSSSYTFEVEYYLDNVKEGLLIEKLKPYFTNIKSPLLKYGYIGINHTGTDCVEDELKWTHITGR